MAWFAPQIQVFASPSVFATRTGFTHGMSLTSQATHIGESLEHGHRMLQKDGTPLFQLRGDGVEGSLGCWSTNILR